jgi:Fic family protein
MRMPICPPDFSEILLEAMENERLPAVLEVVSKRDPRGKYLHWDKLRFHTPPGDLSHREWWLALKLHRSTQHRSVPLKDIEGNAFIYALVDPIPERLHDIDLRAGGAIAMPDLITNPETKDRYLVSSLIEEAITSSQLEGAATTRLVAKELIRTGRRPRDRSEQMILNNFRTMQRISELQHERLTTSVVLDIHRLITADALDNPSATGRFRLPNEEVVVDGMYGQVFHVPPLAEKLEGRMDAMCEFANAEGKGEFVHPAIRSIILHFWLAYDHPFVDGNGRTARALFYWSMLKHGFWLCEFISISEIIVKAPTKYGRAFLYTETDGNDLTYFILYHIDVLRRAIDQLHKYVGRKTEELRALERQMRGMAVLNHRQRALIGHALRHAHHRYTIESHRRSHNVVYQTARTDLLDLVDRGLFDKDKIGREWQFTPALDLQKTLSAL